MPYKHFIRLCDSIYPVKVEGGIRKVSVRGDWMTIDEFMEHLRDADKWDEILEAASLGANIIQGKQFRT